MCPPFLFANLTSFNDVVSFYNVVSICLSKGQENQMRPDWVCGRWTLCRGAGLYWKRTLAQMRGQWRTADTGLPWEGYRLEVEFSSDHFCPRYMHSCGWVSSPIQPCQRECNGNEQVFVLNIYTFAMLCMLRMICHWRPNIITPLNGTPHNGLT